MAISYGAPGAIVNPLSRWWVPPMNTRTNRERISTVASVSSRSPIVSSESPAAKANATLYTRLHGHVRNPQLRRASPTRRGSAKRARKVGGDDGVRRVLGRLRCGLKQCTPPFVARALRQSLSDSVGVGFPQQVGISKLHTLISNVVAFSFLPGVVVKKSCPPSFP
jgi:hypothetical protein